MKSPALRLLQQGAEAAIAGLNPDEGELDAGSGGSAVWPARSF